MQPRKMQGLSVSCCSVLMGRKGKAVSLLCELGLGDRKQLPILLSSAAAAAESCSRQCTLIIYCFCFLNALLVALSIFSFILLLDIDLPSSNRDLV